MVDNRMFHDILTTSVFIRSTITAREKKMKKTLLILVFSVCAACSAFAECKLGFWFDVPRDSSTKIVLEKGVLFGLPLAEARSVRGSALAVCGTFIHQMRGFQGTLFGMTKADSFKGGCQLSFANFADDSMASSAVQVGLYNQSGKDGIQIGLVNNNADNAKFQVGLVNINDDGLFPFMILVNFSRDFFD